MYLVLNLVDYSWSVSPVIGKTIPRLYCMLVVFVSIKRHTRSRVYILDILNIPYIQAGTRSGNLFILNIQ